MSHSPNMFSALQRKFVAIIMVVVAIVTALSFSAVVFAKYQADDDAVRSALSDAANAASSKGSSTWHQLSVSFSSQEPPPKPEDSEQEQAAVSDDAGVEDAPDNQRQWREPPAESVQITHESIHIGKPEGKQPSVLIPVAVYQFPSSEESEAVLTSEMGTASISEEVSEEALDVARAKHAGYSRMDEVGLVCYKVKVSSGTTYIAFTDSSYADSWMSLALWLLGVWAVVMAVLLVVSVFLSRWALRPVRQAWDSQRQFVADASHDLKTPLTVILANMSILQQSPQSTIAAESQWIENTQREAEGMQQLVSEMLQLAQVESAPEQALARGDVALGQLLEGECLLFDAMAIENGCDFAWEPSDGPVVKGDAQKLSVMFKTLIENAFKYAGAGGNISVDIQEHGKQATVAIANSGSPIAPEDLEHIFDRFYRADKARTSGSGGFGLGLAIAKQIALSHGGDISCRSSEEEGTVFTVSLPLT